MQHQPQRVPVRRLEELTFLRHGGTVPPSLQGMDTGIGYFATHDAAGPGEVARLVEEHGHDAIYFAEHTHIPASRETPYAGGGELPRKYAHTYDLFVTMTAAAAATSRLRIGSGICLVVERDPITTAKEVASVDHLSGGRVEFGVGAGWNREEMANHGTDPRTRMKLLAERVEAMKAIWTQDEASYHGRFVDFDRIWSWPKPAQAPHPPVLVGGNGPTVLDRAEAFGDAWFPNFARGNVLERIPEARERGIPVLVMSVPADAKALEQLREAGVRRVVRWLPSAGLLAGRGGAGALRGGRRGAERRVTARERFATARVARLATTGPDGPHVVPIVFALDGDVLYHAVDHKPKRTTALKRLDNLRADPRASVLADAYDEDWARLWWARADGTARILEPGHAPAIERLRERYPQYRERPPEGPVIAIDVTRWSDWTAAAPRP